VSGPTIGASASAAAAAAPAGEPPSPAAPAADPGDPPEGLRDLAEKVNSAKLMTLGRLVAGVAHELNTPMGALNSNHDTLKRAIGRLQDILADEVVSPDELNEVRRIVSALNGVLRVNDLAIERMRGLVASLRSFGRPDRALLERVEMRELIDSALALLRHETTDRIDVKTEYAPLPAIEVYPQQLGQVFMNLLLNAIQAIPGKGTVSVRTAAADAGVQVVISDTGSGIAPENLKRIFEPGFTTKGDRVGMGLGLLITQQILDQHGGRMTVASTVGQGTTFTLYIPDGGGSRRETAPAIS
jgi:two-component system NtrC family sensor kinase